MLKVIEGERKARGFPHGRRQSRRNAGVGCGKPEAFRTEGGRAAETPGWLRKAKGIPHGKAAEPRNRQVGGGKPEAFRPRVWTFALRKNSLLKLRSRRKQYYSSMQGRLTSPDPPLALQEQQPMIPA